jgi:hypothetical protein
VDAGGLGYAHCTTVKGPLRHIWRLHARTAQRQSIRRSCVRYRDTGQVAMRDRVVEREKERGKGIKYRIVVIEYVIEITRVRKK